MAISYKPIDIHGEIEKVLSPEALKLYQGLRSGIKGGWAVEALKNPEIQAQLKKYGVQDVGQIDTFIEQRMPRVGVITTEQLKNINPTQLQDLGGLFSGIDGAKNRSLISQNTPEGNLMREKYLTNLRATLERRGANEVIDMLNKSPQLFTPDTITNYTTFAQDPLKYKVDTTRPVGQSGAVLEQPLFGGGTDTGTAPVDWKAQLVKAGGIAPSDTSTNKLSLLDQQLLDAAKKGRKEFDELYGQKQKEFQATHKNVGSYDFKNLLGKNGATEVDYGGGYKLRKGADYTQDYGKNGSTSWNTFDLIDPQGNVVKNIRHTDSKSTAQQIKQALADKFGSGSFATNGFNEKMNYLSNLGLQDAKGYWDKQYKDQRAITDAQDYGTFKNAQGKTVVMHTPEDLKTALVLGLKKLKDGTTPLKGAELNMIAEATTTGNNLKASLEAYLKANPPVQGTQQTYDPATGKTTYADGRVEQSTAPQTATYSIASAGQQQTMGDNIYRINGQLVSEAMAKQMGYDTSKLTPTNGLQDQVGAQSITTQPTSGTIPGYKGVYAGKESLSANDAAVNNLFKQYHGRDANITELNYWRNKKIGDLENTLAKTQIFSKEDADKIRAQMQAEGKTYISNQAELEQLAKSGKVSPASLTTVSQQGGMLFTPTSGGIGTGQGTGTTTGGVSGGTGTGTTGGTGTGTQTDDTVGSAQDAIINQVADAVGNPNASEIEILEALNKIKNSQIDPYYKQLISQAQRDVSLSINRLYEDRIRQLQSESFNLAENIANTQKSLESSGMTFSGEAIKKLGTLSSFAQGTTAGLTPAQLGQGGQQVMGGQVVPGQTMQPPAVGLPKMTAEQMGIEGSVNLGNRLTAESSRTGFNRKLEDIGQNALRLLGTQGVQNLGLPTQALANQPETTGTMQYNYANALQSTYGNLANQEGDLTDYQKLFL